MVPSKAPATIPEFFCNVLQSLGSLSDVDHEPAVDLYAYDTLMSTANVETELTIDETAGEGQFMVGQDLESFSGASPDSLFSGYNSSTEDIHWVLKYDAAAVLGGNISVKFDTFAMFDQVVIVEDGLMSVIY